MGYSKIFEIAKMFLNTNIETYYMDVIGIDMGGTSIDMGLVDKNLIKKRIAVPTNAKTGKTKVLKALTEGIDKLFNKNVKAIGIGVPGSLNIIKGNIIELVNIPDLNGFNIKKFLEKKYAVPVSVNNDTNCLALGEKFFGAAKKYDDVVGIIIGTGFGAGIILNQKLFCGKDCAAGEFGEITFKYKTVEDYCSGKFFKGQGYDGKDLFEKAKKMNKEALEIFRQYGTHLGEALSMIVNSLNPEAIVLGGSVANASRFYKKSMMLALKTNSRKESFQRVNIFFSTSRETSILGASLLCNNKNIIQ